MQCVHWVARGLGGVIGATAVALLVALGAADAQGGGALLVTVRAGGQDAKAQVVIKTATAQPEQVAKGRSGTPIPVPDGSYDVEVTCTDLVDHPVQTLRGVEISGGTVEREVAFPAGTVVLHVKRGGRPLNNAKLHLKRSGEEEELPGTAKTGAPFRASPGQYEAEILVGRGRRKMSHTITGIQVYDGAKRSIPVSL